MYEATILTYKLVHLAMFPLLFILLTTAELVYTPAGQETDTWIDSDFSSVYRDFEKE